jgi:hypothetical protein
MSNGLTLQEFATSQGLTKCQALYLAKRGRIFGATKDHGGKWRVFPPALITEPLAVRKTWRTQQQVQPVGSQGAAVVGTSPHGLSANGHRTEPKSSRNGGPASLADGVGVLLLQDAKRPVSNSRDTEGCK